MSKGKETTIKVQGAAIAHNPVFKGGELDTFKKEAGHKELILFALGPTVFQTVYFVLEPAGLKNSNAGVFIPSQAGIQKALDSRLRGNDGGDVRRADRLHGALA